MRRLAAWPGPTALVLVASSACADRAAVPDSATGTLEYVQVDIAPLTPARILRVLRREGDSVRAGDTLVVLTQSAARPETDLRRARLAAADAQLRDLIAGARPAEIAAAEAEVRAAEADADRAAREVERVTTLAARGDVTRQQLDALETAARVAAARRDAARQALRVLRDGARPDRVAAARADVASARSALDAAERAEADLVLTAPTAGMVLLRHAEPGEVLSPGVPTMTIGDVGRPYVRVYVGQGLVPRLRPGNEVQVFLDAFPDRPFVGRIASIATRAEFTPRVALTRDEREDLLYGVRVELVDTTGMLRAGLPVTVRFGAAPGR